MENSPERITAIMEKVISKGGATGVMFAEGRIEFFGFPFDEPTRLMFAARYDKLAYSITYANDRWIVLLKELV